MLTIFVKHKVWSCSKNAKSTASLQPVSQKHLYIFPATCPATAIQLADCSMDTTNQWQWNFSSLCM